jgi:SPP1 family predicted phage head-tail adaptor
MRAADLKNRVTIEQLTQSKDTFGGMVDVWGNVATVWAGIRNLPGTERRLVKAGGQIAEARTEITVRWRAGITAQMRVKKGATIYNIRHVNDYNEGHEFIILTCDVGVNDGR